MENVRAPFPGWKPPVQWACCPSVSKETERDREERKGGEFAGGEEVSAPDVTAPWGQLA